MRTQREGRNVPSLGTQAASTNHITNHTDLTYQRSAASFTLFLQLWLSRTWFRKWSRLVRRRTYILCTVLQRIFCRDGAGQQLFRCMCCSRNKFLHSHATSRLQRQRRRIHHMIDPLKSLRPALSSSPRWLHRVGLGEIVIFRVRRFDQTSRSKH